VNILPTYCVLACNLTWLVPVHWQTWWCRWRADHSTSAASTSCHSRVTQGPTPTSTQGVKTSQQGGQTDDDCIECWQTRLSQNWPAVGYVLFCSLL